jgi:hypothetical protein
MQYYYDCSDKACNNARGPQEEAVIHDIHGNVPFFTEDYDNSVPNEYKFQLTEADVNLV